MKKNLGTLNITSDELPEMKDWKVGETYEVTMKVKMTGMREATQWDMNSMEDTMKTPPKPPKGMMSGTFEVLTAEPEEKETTPPTMEEWAKKSTAVKTGKIVLGKKRNY